VLEVPAGPGRFSNVGERDSKAKSGCADLSFPGAGEDYAGLEGIGDDKIRLNSSSLDNPVVILHDQMGRRSF
jgi:hypothetical protein